MSAEDTTNADILLMQRVAKNDETALAVLYDRFVTTVYKLALQAANNDKTKAESLTESIFVKLWRKAKDFDPDRNNLNVFVTKTARQYLNKGLSPEAKAKIVENTRTRMAS